MKKVTLLALAGIISAGLSAQTVDELSVTTTFAYESEYVFRGVKLSQAAFQPAVDVAYMGAYFGIWTNQPITPTSSNVQYSEAAEEADLNGDGDQTDTVVLNVDSPYQNEVDFYAGYAFPVTDMIELDVGVTVYYYPEFVEELDQEEYTTEIYVGGSFDVGGGFGASAYAYYDFDLEAFTFEGSGSYSLALTDNLALDLGAYIGWVSPDEGDESFYYGTTADVGYTVNEAVSVSSGVRWAGNDADSENDSFLWWGFSATAGF